MKEPLSFALHSFTDLDSIPFNKKEYSLFKYGSIKSARTMGIELGKAFCMHFFENTGLLSRKESFVVIPSSYAFIPSAANALKDYFLQELNSYLLKYKSGKLCEYAKIHRYSHYHQDYASLSYEERTAITQNDVRYLDPEFLKDKTIIFLDDVFITGRHEEMVEEVLVNYDLSDIRRIHVYYAKLVGSGTNPEIESILNTYCKPTVFDLSSDLSDGFVFNTRLIKFILKSKGNTKDFIKYFGKCQVGELYQKSISEGYSTYLQYKPSLAIIKKFLDR